MANENKTVEQLCDYLANNDNSVGEPIGVAMPRLAECILAAHKCKLAAKDRIIEAKDAEIARLVNIINTECNKCGDCAKFGGDCSAGDVDGNEDCRACSRFVPNQIASLRVLVKELADALKMEIVCHEDCATIKVCARAKRCDSREYRALIAKAREVLCEK